MNRSSIPSTDYAIERINAHAYGSPNWHRVDLATLSAAIDATEVVNVGPRVFRAMLEELGRAWDAPRNPGVIRIFAGRHGANAHAIAVHDETMSWLATLAE